MIKEIYSQSIIIIYNVRCMPLDEINLEINKKKKKKINPYLIMAILMNTESCVFFTKLSHKRKCLLSFAVIG